jgi:hypothetical protein
MASTRPKPKPAGRGPTTPGTRSGTAPGSHGPEPGRPDTPPAGPSADCACLVMVPCTTNLKGNLKVGVHDAGQPHDQSVEVECRVHAIAYRGAEVKANSANPNAPDQPGTWYLITLKELEWKRNPMWIHEDDSQLNLGY